jgi:uncharacterized Zn finger protein
MKESRSAKALRYVREERVRVTSANEYGIRLSVRGSGADPYLVSYGKHPNGASISGCTCPAPGMCAHIEVARLLRGSL